MPNEDVILNDSEAATRPPDIEATAAALDHSKRWTSFSLTALLILACVYTLYFGKSFLAPVILAIVFNLLLSPFVRALTKIRIPEALGAALVMLAGATIVSLAAYEFSGPVSEWVGRAPQILGKMSTGLEKLKMPVQKVTQAGEQVSKIAQVAPPAGKKPTEVEVKPPGILSGVFAKTRDLVLGVLVFVILLFFLLASGDLFLRKLIHVLPRLQDKKRAVVIMREIEDHISKYLITVAMINACLGLAGTCIFWAFGMPTPWLWGASAFLLNFIPYLGALTEIIMLGLVAASTFPHLGHALLVPASYLGLATLEANLFTPYIMGRRMTLNPVIVFAAVTFWGFLWGILGVFLAVPVLVMLKIVCEHIAPLAPIAEFLGQ
ncbi:MAG TPA: AI-2E family transporter [Bryobacteraceae bacterium]|nr:AI-2E family transporter [Bryobacteraceae bacterium]